MQIVAVSVDPKGDTPKVVKEFLRSRELTGKATWLLGTRAQLRPVWIAYNIDAKSVPETPAIIEHVSLIYGIDATRPHPRRLSGVADQPEGHGARRSHPRAREVTIP